MVEIYCGDGKGKTTAAVGLAVRAAGHGIPVIFVQFLKNDGSGEIAVLQSLPQVTVLHPRNFFGFVRNMTEEQRNMTAEDYALLLEQIEELLNGAAGRRREAEASIDRGEAEADITAMVILDEVIHACNFGLLEEKVLSDFVRRQPEHTEIILTGRGPSERLRECADYISEIQNVRHPFERGICARTGVEL